MSLGQVLIVSCDPEVLWPLQSACNECGFETLVSPDGLRAIMRSLREQPDFFIIDAGSNGIEALTICELLSKDRRTALIQSLLMIDPTDYYCMRRCQTVNVQFIIKQSEYAQRVGKALAALVLRHQRGSPRWRTREGARRKAIMPLRLMHP